MPSEEPRDGEDGSLSEMEWLGSEVGFVLGEIGDLEEADLEDDEVGDIIASIVTALREWLKFAKREQYREPENVRIAADELADEARTVLDRMPRKKGRLQIPVVAALQHLQDFRDRLMTCIATPVEYRETEEA
ncbi:MAG TPA: hypothetical protein PKV72_06745 [Candidatus Peribacteria bacterium]|nr:hypothetical protein [Candidatus Peribacteria bacterium]